MNGNGFCHLIKSLNFFDDQIWQVHKSYILDFLYRSHFLTMRLVVGRFRQFIKQIKSSVYVHQEKL